VESLAGALGSATRRVTMLKTLAFLSLAFPGHSSPGSMYRCGRSSVRAATGLRLCDRHMHHARAWLHGRTLWSS